MRKVILLSLLFVVMFVLPTAQAAWDVSYDGDVLPGDAIPAWGTAGTIAASLGIDSGVDYLRMDTSANGTSYIFGSGSGFWNPDFSTGVVVEARIRALDDTKQCGGINIGDGSIGAGFQFYATATTDLLSIKKSDGTGNAYVAIGGAADDWHVYKIVAMGSTWELFIDGASAYTDNLYGPNGQYIVIGDNKTSSAENAIVDYDYIHYSNVPEPATIFLLGISGVMYMRKRK